MRVFRGEKGEARGAWVGGLGVGWGWEVGRGRYKDSVYTMWFVSVSP